MATHMLQDHILPTISFVAYAGGLVLVIRRLTTWFTQRVTGKNLGRRDELLILFVVSPTAAFFVVTELGIGFVINMLFTSLMAAIVYDVLIPHFRGTRIEFDRNRELMFIMADVLFSYVILRSVWVWLEVALPQFKF